MDPIAEIKGGFDELKAAATQSQQAIAELRAEVEAVKGHDPLDAEKIQRIEAGVADKIAAEQKAVDARLAALEAAKGRPGAPGAAPAEDAERKQAFTDYMRGRIEGGEYKAMTQDSAPDGGFLIVPTMADQIVARKRRSSPLRGVANAVSIAGSEFQVPLERGDTGAGWSGERSTRSETDTPTLDLVSIPVHEMTASPKLSQRMIDDTDFDLESFLVGRIADRFGRLEATAFVAGDGVAKPKGFTSYATAATGDASRAGGVLEHVNTGANGGFVAPSSSASPADAFIDLLYKLHPMHRAAAVWGANSAVLATIAKFKDGDGNYLLHRIDDANAPSAIAIRGLPVVEMEDMPAAATGSLSVVLGNFSEGYTIVDRTGMTLLRDPFSAKPFVLFYATKRVGGGVSDFDAIKFLRLAS